MSEKYKSGKTAVIQRQMNKYDQQQIEQFVHVMQDPYMRYADKLDYIQSEIAQSKKMVKLNYEARCFKNDGVYQVSQAINQHFGAVVSREDKSPSGDSDIQTMDIELADGTRIKAPFGDIQLDGLGEDACLSINYDERAHELKVTCRCQMRYSSLIDEIMNSVKENLKSNSIYKNQALEITDINYPVIMDLSGIDNQLMVLSKQLKYDIKSITNRIMYPDRCVAKGVPLKYGALLEGGYGTGKTLLAFKLAKMAIENGWVFIYLKDPTQLAETLRMSQVIDKSGHGAVVFVEDVDQVVRGTRDTAMQDILNTLDGGDTKNMNVICLFTTNHIELIEPTFLRGKRIGSIISLGGLDEETADEFIRRKFEEGGGCYELPDNLSEVCKVVAQANGGKGIAPAFMAEIVEKVKTDMIAEDICAVSSEQLMYAIKSYEHQVELSQTKDMTETPEQKFVESYRALFCKDPSHYVALVKMLEEHCEDDIEDYEG